MGDFYLDKETKDILSTLDTRKKSLFVREAIKEKMYMDNNPNEKKQIILSLENLRID